MRKEPTDNYINFALLGNNIYDMNFMKIYFYHKMLIHIIAINIKQMMKKKKLY